MAGFYFAFAAVESSLRNFTSAFAVSSDLKLSRAQGSDLLAFFYFAFAGGRILIIPMSLLVSPGTVVWVSLFLLSLATGSLCFWAQHSLLALRLGITLAGVGIASVFASGMLWVKEILPVTNRVGSVFIMSCSSACQVYAMLIGGYMEDQPMMFPYITAGTVVGLMVCFTLANIVAISIRRFKKNNELLSFSENGV